MRSAPVEPVFLDLDQKGEGYRPSGLFGVHVYAKHPSCRNALSTFCANRGRTVGGRGVAVPSRFFLHPQAPRAGGLPRSTVQQYLQPAHAAGYGRYPKRAGVAHPADVCRGTKTRTGAIRAVGLLPKDIFDHHLPRQGQATARSLGGQPRRKGTLYPPKAQKPDRDALQDHALRRGICRPAQHKPQGARQNDQEPL